MIATVTQSSALTAECINPVMTAVKTVFETMLSCTPKRTGLTLKETMEPHYELSAVIGISGKTAGTIVVSLSLGTAVQVLNRMVGIEATEITTEVCDSVGELANMIAGSAKSNMEKLELSISVPNVVSGKDHEIHFPSNVKPICIIYESELGPFAVQAGFSDLQ
jgi:chemotaxis protein CheX